MAKKTKQTPATLGSLRKEIDNIDNQIIDLLNSRAGLAKKIGKVKIKNDQRGYVPERERELLDRLAKRNKGVLPVESLRLIYKEIISASLALESPLVVTFLGPEATFTHEATKRHFGMSGRLLPKHTISDVFEDVERSRSDYGVVPIENSIEGVVNHTLDRFMRSELSICAEVLLAVSHHLLNRTGQLEGITKVYSHPQALAQCRGSLMKILPGIPLVDVSSTGRAAQLAAEDASAAALASDLAASFYTLQIVSSHLEDVKDNLTRFLIIGQDKPGPSGSDRTSIVFALKDEPGILFKALDSFANEKINMSRIESRPSRRKAWDYLFFIDLDGHCENSNLKQAISLLSRTCEFMKVLGSYPQGTLDPKE